MSELKAYNGDVYIPVYGSIADAQVYLKSDADKVIAEKDKEISELKEDLHAANEQIENLINSASGIMLFQDKVNGNTCQELRYNKYKRCLAMAAKYLWKRNYWRDSTPAYERQHQWENMAYKHYKRWLALAEKFKEAK